MLIGKREEVDDLVLYQSLYGHVYDSLKILKKYFQINHEIIKSFCEHWDIDVELFLKNLFIFIYFHDLGKLIQEFQENIKRGRFSNNFPHALFSFFLLKNLNYQSILSFNFELLSVLGHHTQLHSSIYDDKRNIPHFLEKQIENYIDSINAIYEKINFHDFFELNFSNFYPDFKFNYIQFIKFRNSFIKQSFRFENKFLLKSVFSYFFSILQLCDDYSSYNFHNFVQQNSNNKKIFYQNVLEETDKFVWNLNSEKYLSRLFKDYAPYKFQEILFKNPNKYTLLFAPCGRGKTEAALGWALSSLSNFNKNKIIFAMPTQVTSNAMWERLSEIFGHDNVGLYHGKSFIKLSDSLDYMDYNEIHSEVFKGNIFFKPITITTIDHLIYSFVHGFSQSDFALGNLQTSVIIFDEVHYYDEKTLNHLYTLYSILRKMNIPHILMSGTLPNFIVNELHNYQNIVDNEGLNFQPFTISYSSEVLIKTKEKFDISKELLAEIDKNYKEGLKQFFIFNTIERAKQFYMKLKDNFKDYNIVLYHSQFTHSDRVKKENEIIKKSAKKSSFILIATQIIEISLDISADIMYTELAPPDALGQRGGRLNRKKQEGPYIMNIFETENHFPYDPDLINKTRDSLELGKITYLSFKEWCDVVYNNRKLKESNLIDFFNDSVLFGNQPRDIAFSEEQGNKLEIRDSSFQKVDVIPIEIFNGDIDNLIVQNQVKVPLWWINKDEVDNLGNARVFFNEDVGNKQFIISKMKYTYEMGFIKDEIVTIDDFDEWCS